MSHGDTLLFLLQRAAQDRPEHPAVEDGARTLGYGALHAAAEALAARLLGAGVVPGARVLLHLRPGADEVIAWFAVMRLGAIAVPTHQAWRARQLRHVLEDSGASAVVSDAPGRWPDAGVAVVTPGGPPAGDPLPLPAPPEPDALAAIFYTSGSTGSPKGVTHTHGALAACARSITQTLGNTPDDRLLGLLPLAFHYGFSQLSTMVTVGGTLILEPLVMPAAVLDRAVEHRVTGIAGVPATWALLTGMLQEAPRALPDLRYVTNAGGALSPRVLQALPEVFPGVDIHLLYGMTEALRSTALPPGRFAEKPGAIGCAVPGAEVFVVAEDGRLCDTGQLGELVHRGAFVSPGYWRQPEASARKFRPCPAAGEGARVCWSGDLVRRDAEGILWFVSRKDALMKVGGYRVGPGEIEDALVDTGLVDEAVAVGVPHPVTGQAVAVAVSGPDVDEAALKRAWQRDLPRYMWPQRLLVWPGPLPRTATGKPDRAAVRAALG
ncbi:MAG: AMP-binding protein [Alphaproteobacteria bacterium]|nr:AMP-binding protein [Alphaproteobacteria bacterium]